MVGFKPFRKKPVVVEAWQIKRPKDATALEAAIPGAFIVREHHGAFAALVVPTLEGDHWARLGDWIIRGVAGEYYPCKPDIFAQTYEVAE